MSLLWGELVSGTIFVAEYGMKGCQQNIDFMRAWFGEGEAVLRSVYRPLETDDLDLE